LKTEKTFFLKYFFLNVIFYYFNKEKQMQEFETILKSLSNIRLSTLKPQTYDFKHEDVNIKVVLDQGFIESVKIIRPEEKNTWSKVPVSFNKRQLNYLKVLTDRYNCKQFYVFSDNANSETIDFVSTTPDFKSGYDICIQYKHSHMVCVENELPIVFNFKGSIFKQFNPTMKYLCKFSSWYLLLQSNELPDDKRSFYVFEEASSWKSFKFLCILKGLLNVRNYIKKTKLNWSHAYCPETNMIYDFSHRHFSFIEKVCHVDERTNYLNKIKDVFV
jgi:hypothetical protein